MLVFCKTKYNVFPEVYPCNSIIDMLLENCSMKVTILILLSSPICLDTEVGKES